MEYDEEGLPILDNVQWKQIDDYENYWISNTGLVFNKKLKHVLPGWIRNGYRAVALIRDKKARTYAIHRLVAQAFIPNPENKPVIDHIGPKLNNNVSNLRWATYTENNYNRGISPNNTSGYKGVSLHKPSGRWLVHLGKKHIGLFDTAELGYEAYCKAAQELHGEFFHP
jgi:hypothetical protein